MAEEECKEEMTPHQKAIVPFKPKKVKIKDWLAITAIEQKPVMDA